MASKLVIIIVFILDLIAVGLAIAAEQRRSVVSLIKLSLKTFLLSSSFFFSSYQSNLGYKIIELFILINLSEQCLRLQLVVLSEKSLSVRSLVVDCFSDLVQKSIVPYYIVQSRARSQCNGSCCNGLMQRNGLYWVIVFGLQGKVVPDKEKVYEYCEYGSDIATSYGAGAFVLLLTSQVIIMVASRCFCCGKALNPGGSRACAIMLFLICW